MSDFLLDLASHPRTRRLIKRLGLPIPLPTPLDREVGPWTAAPLADRNVAVGSSAGPELIHLIAATNLLLGEPGAEGRLAGPLRFLLSARSAFVTGQPIVVDPVATGGVEPPWQRPLDKKVVLVTGAARGIGEATARRAAAEGAQL